MKTDVRRALESFNELLELHEAHTWKQVGRCVYCDDCQERLYQGRLPAERKPARRPPPEPAATTEMRSRWNKT
jgi:hypothetical protein